VVLLIMIASWAIVRGLFEIVAAIKLRKVMEGEWVLALSGVVSILLGMLLLRNPAAGALAVVMIIGIYMLVFGAAAVLFSFRLKGVKDRLSPAASRSGSAGNIRQPQFLPSPCSNERREPRCENPRRIAS
jgi:hypothetical protein